MDRSEKMSKLESINNEYTCTYEWDYLGMYVGVQTLTYRVL